MIRKPKYLVIFGLMLLYACSVEDDQLVLDTDYLHVADVLQYCQGSCSGTLDWEGSEILLQGHVPDVTNDSILNDYYNRSRFYLSDIRNGMFMEIRVEGDQDAIFQFLSGVGKQDQVYIRGQAESVILNEGDECLKGVIVELDNVMDISLN